MAAVKNNSNDYVTRVLASPLDIDAAAWNSRKGGFDPAEVEKRRAAIIERGRKMA